jgi:hypothetical protein
MAALAYPAPIMLRCPSRKVPVCKTGYAGAAPARSSGNLDVMGNVLLIVLIVTLLLSGVGLIVVFHAAVWHWILWVTGISPGSTRWTIAWGGFLSAGVISGSIFTHAYHSMRSANCHNKGCWRIGVHQTPDGYRLCKRCIAKPKKALVLHTIHPDHVVSSS